MSATLTMNVIVSSAGFGLGSIYLKRFADGGALNDLGAALLIFALANLVYADVLAKGLGQGAVLSGMTQLILMSAAGVLLFGERLGPYHVAGLISAVATIWLFALAAHAQ